MRDAPPGLLRLVCHAKCFYPCKPYDDRCDETRKGTGFLLRVDASTVVVLTAHHVVRNAERITCTSFALPRSAPLPLTLLGVNPHLDVAVLSGPPEVMRLEPFAGVASSSSLAPQQQLVCLGFARGTFRTHTTSGTVSGRADFPHNRVQTDAVINPGNSGGPVLDAKTREVVGVVTSGMARMQSTNFFAPLDEVRLSLARMLARRKEGGEGGEAIGVDMGYALDAVVKPVDAAACGGERGGALVVGAPRSSALREGDVLLAVAADAEGKRMVDLDVFMRTRVDSLWAHDAVDFRTILDSLASKAPRVGWRVRARRGGEEKDLVVEVGPSRLGSRTLHPDCEPVRYVSYGGLVAQTMSLSHATGEEGERHGPFAGSLERVLRDPRARVLSFPVLTHVAAGSPFSVHGEARLTGAEVVAVYDRKGERRPVRTLDDLARAVREVEPLVLELGTGARVGCTEGDLTRFDARKGKEDPVLARGMHAIRFGPNRSRSRVEGEEKKMGEQDKEGSVETKTKEPEDDSDGTKAEEKVEQTLAQQENKASNRKKEQTLPSIDETPPPLFRPSPARSPDALPQLSSRRASPKGRSPRALVIASLLPPPPPRRPLLLPSDAPPQGWSQAVRLAMRRMLQP